MKKFVYEVAGFEYTDSEAFGTAWRQAKAKAAELHAAVYRLVIKGEGTRREVYTTGGCFLFADRVQADWVMVF